MLRSFLPVGQGAFYLESFDFDDYKCNIVFDCGSSTRQGIIEQLINREFASGETIDAIFLSHLDEDHINGLPYLLDRCKVKNLFFPLITDADKVYMQLNALLANEKNSFLQRFIANPTSVVHTGEKESMTHLFAVFADGYEGEYNIESESNFMHYIPSGTDVAPILSGLQNKPWKLVPYNFKQKSRLVQLKNAVIRIFGCDNDSVDDTIRKLLQDYPQDEQSIKEAYKAVSGSFNINSMTLFSGIVDHNVKQNLLASNKCCCYCDCLGEKESGCLYLGDYDASSRLRWDALKEAYNEYWGYIGCIQIPHHGSTYNYNKEIADIHAFNVISAGSKSKYHPSRSVLLDLFNSSCTAFVVTEEENSRVDLAVNLFYGKFKY